MMFEVEAKYPLPDRDRLLTRLAGWSAGEDRQDSDQYFNAPDRDFAVTDEAVRIRSVGDRHWITYKGPKVDPLTKTRFELELPLGDGPAAVDAWADLLHRLGYRPTAVVRKQRRILRSTRDGFDVTVTLDRVDGLGDYAELEIVAPEGDVERARHAVLALAAELGLGPPERRSYLQMLLGRAAEPAAPVVFREPAEVRRYVRSARRAGERIGLVPTMGALHDGHVALIKHARAGADRVIVSIFVNPTQFGPDEDYARYPRTWDADLAACAAAGVDAVYAPSIDLVYPPGFATAVEPGPLAEVYEGAIRPGHFRGVATVVLKLFNTVQPDSAYFGQKDAQQVAVIRRMAADLDLDVALHVAPTVREPDGLAMSSRNRYLDAAARTQAAALFRGLCRARDAWVAGERDPAALRERMTAEIARLPDARLDYADVVDPRTFAAPSPDGPALAIIAVRFGTTRLIDNLPLTGDAAQTG
jgi:pantoate--beta-alanine ligase